MKIRKFKKSNEGSALIMTLVLIMFLTVLGVSVLSAATMGYKLKNMSYMSDGSYYKADASMDEINNAVAMIAYDSLKDSYQYTYQNLMITTPAGSYVMSNDEANDAMAKKYYETVRDVFSTETLKNADGSLAGTTAEMTISDKLTELLGSGYGIDFEVKSVKLDYLTADGKKLPEKEKTVTLQGVCVKYNHTDNEYYADVTTDIVISYPKFADIEFSPEIGGNFRGLTSFRDFGIVSGGSIKVDGASSVTGGIYANGNLNVASSLTQSSGKVITGGNVAISGAAGDFNTSNLWVNNIILNAGTIKTDSACNLYVQDDLQLDGTAVNTAKIAGNYYGYNYSQGNDEKGSHTKSSAIIVNSENSVLNFTGINELVVAGVAYLNKFKTGSGDIEGAEMPYRTSESIAVKGAQFVYVVSDSYFRKDSDGNAIRTEKPTITNDFFGYECLTDDKCKPDTNNGKWYYDIKKDPVTMKKFFSLLFTNENDDHIDGDERKAIAEKVLESYTKYIKNIKNNQIVIDSAARVYTTGVGSKDNNYFAENDLTKIHNMGLDYAVKYGIYKSFLLDLPKTYLSKGDIESPIFYNSMKQHFIYDSATNYSENALENILQGKLSDYMKDGASRGLSQVMYYRDDNGDSLPDDDYRVYVASGDCSLHNLVDWGHSSKGLVICYGNITVDCAFSGTILCTGSNEIALSSKDAEVVKLTGGNITANPDAIDYIIENIPEVRKYFTGFDAADKAAYDYYTDIGTKAEATVAEDETEEAEKTISDVVALDCVKYQNYKIN